MHFHRNILCIDDDASILQLIKKYLEMNQFHVDTASNGRDGLSRFNEIHHDTVLLDMNMPVMDGLQVLSTIKETSPETPVIIISGSGNMKNVIEALRLGAWDYITKPVEDLSIIKISVEKALEKAQIIDENREYKANLEKLVDKKTAQLKDSNNYLEITLKEIVKSFGALTEKRDPYTAGHQKRVSVLAGAIAEDMGLDAEKIKYIKMAGMLHDVGKISVPQELLSKPAYLENCEFELVKTHSIAGYDILKNIPFKYPIAEIIHQHHERLDGSGYPRGLKGSEIMMESQILVIADVVEAMASHRPYRPSIGLSKALEEISDKKNSCYCGPCVDSCINVFNKNNEEIAQIKKYFT